MDMLNAIWRLSHVNQDLEAVRIQDVQSNLTGNPPLRAKGHLANKNAGHLANPEPELFGVT